MLKKIFLVAIPLAMSTVALVYAQTAEHQHRDNEKIVIAKDDHKDDEEHKEHDDHKDADEHKDHDDHKDDDEHKEHDDHKDDEHKEHDDEKRVSLDDGHGHDNEHEEPALVKVSVVQQEMAGVKVAGVAAKDNIKQIISAPGEVVNDLYHTTLLSIQIDSKVLSRKVVLGQHVKKGDVVAVLYSVDIATAQNQLKVSIAEWQRVKKLGKKTVGEKRYIEARAGFEKDKSLLLAYGFNQRLLKQFLGGKNPYQSGQYPMIAPHDGVILEDNFQAGQYLLTGSSIALLVNEDQVWVDALLPPELGQSIPVGSLAEVEIGQRIFNASVIHDSHAIDEITRTRKIRLKINNTDHLLHAGLFANVHLQLPLIKPVMLLPETALMRSEDGDWTVFIEQEPGIFKQEEVELEKSINGLQSIKGLKSGERIAMEGAFFLASEMAKGGFDPHNH